MAPGKTENEAAPQTEGAGAAATPAKKVNYSTIPGPLGLKSASLEGKVALVTGAGKQYNTPLVAHVFLPLARWLSLHFVPACLARMHHMQRIGPASLGTDPGMGKSGAAP